jgi:3-hydroxyanthranilate 3,4-dioxygenase
MITRGRFQNLFDLANEVGPWDERLVAPPFADPQVSMSHGSGPQPFFLICEKDTIITQYTGEADVELRYSGTRRTRLEIGDMLYVPAGTPSRIEPREDSVHLRIKAVNPGLEGVAWFCVTCDAEVWRYEFDATARPAQEGYLEGCARFNAETARRTCGVCQTVHPPVDVAGYHWARIAEEVGAK